MKYVCGSFGLFISIKEKQKSMNDKIKAVIIDDEETAIDNLCFELKKYQWISVDGIARNGKSGIRLIEKERPDLLFWMWNFRIC